MRAVAQLEQTFLVQTRGEGQAAIGRIVNLEEETVLGELPVDSLLRAGYWEEVTDPVLAQQAVDLAKNARGGEYTPVPRA